MFLAVPGTGVLTALIAYAYGRRVRRQLKEAARCDE